MGQNPKQKGKEEWNYGIAVFSSEYFPIDRRPVVIVIMSPSLVFMQRRLAPFPSGDNTGLLSAHPCILI